MLRIDSPVEVAGMTLFRDHLVPRRFHYLPGPPRLLAEGARAGIELLRYRGEAAGGFLSLDVECAWPEATLDAARQTLSERCAGPVELLPVLFESGCVRLIALGAESGLPEETGATAPPRLIERILCTATPSLLGRQRAIFSVELEPQGAALVAQALRAGQTPLLIVYELAFTGLRPARGLRARVAYQMAYDYLRTRFAANRLYVRTDLDRETEALMRHGLITIEDVDYLGSDPAVLRQREEAVRGTLAELADTLFFRPAASPAALGVAAAAQNPALDAAWSQQGRAQAAFVLRDLEQREAAELRYDLTEVAPRTARAAPQGPLTLPAGLDPAAVIRDVDLDWPPPFTEVRAFSLPDANWSGVAAIRVDLRSGDELRSLVLSPEQLEQSALLPRGGLEFRLAASVTPEPEALGSPPEVDPDFRPIENQSLYLDPAAIARRRLVSVVLGAIDPEVVRAVQGRLLAGERAAAFLLDTARPAVQIPVWGAPPLAVEAELATVAGDKIAFASQSLANDQILVILNQPSGLYQLVQVTLQDPLERYSSLLVELESAAGEARRALRLDAAAPDARWSVKRVPGSTFDYRYRTRKVLKDARVIEDDWRAGAGSLLVVGDLDVRLETIEIFLLGAGEALGAVLDLTSLAPPPDSAGGVEILLDPGQTHVRVQLSFLRDEPRRYRVAGQVFLEDGERSIGPREESAEVLILDLGEPT